MPANHARHAVATRPTDHSASAIAMVRMVTPSSEELVLRRTPPLNCRRLTQRRATARLLVDPKAPNCDGFLGHRAWQLQWLVMRCGAGELQLASSCP